MNRLCLTLSVLLMGVSISACTNKSSQPLSNSNQPPSTARSESTPTPSAPAGALQPGQASGSYTANGETTELRYAYAGRDRRFDRDSIVLLLTDKPIPEDAVAEEIKNQPLLQGGQIRGLEYAIDSDKEGIWVRYHSTPYQESDRLKIKDYSVEGEIVKGTDENSTFEGKYSRSVKFVAKIVQ